jgi:hypothetical protein
MATTLLHVPRLVSHTCDPAEFYVAYPLRIWEDSGLPDSYSVKTYGKG